MPRLCILTPDPDDESFHSRWREVFARMAEPLQAAGATVEGRAWTTDEDLSGFDLILPLMVWGNYRAVDRWLDRVADWERQGLPIQNPPSVLRWNVDKIYLDRLRQGGAPTPPTVWVERGVKRLIAGHDRHHSRPLRRRQRHRRRSGPLR